MLQDKYFHLKSEIKMSFIPLLGQPGTLSHDQVVEAKKIHLEELQRFHEIEKHFDALCLVDLEQLPAVIKLL